MNKRREATKLKLVTGSTALLITILAWHFKIQEGNITILWIAAASFLTIANICVIVSAIRDMRRTRNLQNPET